MARDCWSVLGLEPTGDEALVRRSYARLLKSTHPEDNPEGFKELRAAYELALREARWRAEDEADGPWDDDDPDRQADESGADIADSEIAGSETIGGRDAEGAAGHPDAVAVEAAPIASGVAPLPHDDTIADAPSAGDANPESATENQADADWSAHSRLMQALAAVLSADGQHSPWEVQSAYQKVRSSPGLERLDIRASTEEQLSHYLHWYRPRSDVLIETVIADFGWEGQPKSAIGYSAAGSVLALRERVAQEAGAAEFLDRVRKPSHEFHRAFRELSRPVDRKGGLTRLLSLRRMNEVERFLAYVGARQPAAFEALDHESLDWWERRLDRLKAPIGTAMSIARWLVIALAILLIVYGREIMSRDGSASPPIPSVIPTPQILMSEAEIRAHAWKACVAAASGKAGDGTSFGQCEDALRLMPDSLQMRKAAAIALLKDGDGARAEAMFADVLKTSPLDARALYGAGLAQIAESRRREAAGPDAPVAAGIEEGAGRMADAMRLDPEIEAYFRNLGLSGPISGGGTGSGGRLLFQPTKMPRIDTQPKIETEDAQPIFNEAFEHFGLGGIAPDGEIRLECLVSADGKVGDCRIESETPSNQGLGDIALFVASRLTAAPAKLEGRSVDGAPLVLPIKLQSEANAGKGG